MSTISQRIASAFVVLFGRHGDVTQEAHARGQSRQSVYREAAQVIGIVDGAAAQSKMAEARAVSPRSVLRSKRSRSVSNVRWSLRPRRSTNCHGGSGRGRELGGCAGAVYRRATAEGA